MKFAILLLLFLPALSRADDWCSICDSIRNPFGAQTVPFTYEPDPDADDSATEAGLTGNLRLRKRARMHIDITKVNDPLVLPSPRPPAPRMVFTMAMQAAQQINDVRKIHGLPPLILNSYLNEEAMRFAQELYARRGSPLSHDSVRGDTMTRLHNSGFFVQASGENIAEGQTGAAQVVQDWMSSPGHRSNILGTTPVSQRFRRHGMAEYNGFWVHIFSN